VDSEYWIALFISNGLPLVITAVVGFVGIEVRKWVKANATDAQVTAFQKFARIGVQAAEQIYGAGQGDEKFEYAKNFIETELAKRGVKVELDAIQAVIESAVLQEFNWPEAVVSEPGEGQDIVLPVDDGLEDGI
jgi:LL-H family phage holin